MKSQVWLLECGHFVLASMSLREPAFRLSGAKCVSCGMAYGPGIPEFDLALRWESERR